MIKWTEQDEMNALKQGWGVFSLDDGGLAIQKMDDPPAHRMWTEGMLEDCPFKFDEDAQKYVARKARSGDSTARKALKICSRREVAK